ncbi:MAG: RHS repeat-associated core domain-containing protein [Cyclobacteriaceae bacterium]
MEGRSSNVAEYRYGFNGMERNGSNVFGGTSYSTHFRQYDSKIGRWMSVDPMMSSFPDQSSYNFVFNQPIISTDVNGDCPNGDFSEEEVVAANEIVTKYFDPSNNQNEISGELYAAGAEYLSNRFGEDASSKEVGLESFNNLLMNTWSDMKTADFLNSELASTYTELINKTETPEEKFDLIELRAIWVHNDVSSLKTIGFSLEALLAAYPGSVAARNKGVGIRGFNYKPRGVFSSINKIHKNSNSYSGHQGVYEIRKDGKLFKYGKADITKLSSTGNPKRLQTQLNALRKLYPKSTISGKVLYSNKKISTTDIKKI